MAKKVEIKTSKNNSSVAAFSPRKSGPTIYLSIGFKKYTTLLRKLGPHKLSKSCLYLKKIEDIDLKVLEVLIKKGISDLNKKVA